MNISMYIVCSYFIISFAVFGLATNSTQETICPIKFIYQFGDSISDTGNLVRILPFGPTLPSNRLPYGITFPGRPTGRWSNGRLIIDFSAMALGLPLLNPYLNTNASFDSGVNFAVAGSTALDFSFFASRGIVLNPSIPSLSVQIRWFLRQYLPTVCTTQTECDKILRRSLIFMGTIGGNDINFPLSQGRSLEELKTFVPFINQAIVNATREVITAGALQIVIPGNFPIGCIPFVLNALPSNDSSAYDKFGCLISANNLATFQNNHLQGALDSLRREFPKVVIVYADYYNAFRSLLQKASILGIDSRNLLKVCCGVQGGRYNLLGQDFCGNPNVPVCSNPNRYIHWDGLHLTQQAYSYISSIIVKNIIKGIKCVQ